MAWLPERGARAWLAGGRDGGGTLAGWAVSYEDCAVAVGRPSPFCAAHWQAGALIIGSAVARLHGPARQRADAERIAADLEGHAAGWGCCPRCTPGARFCPRRGWAAMMRAESAAGVS